ncbi:hypothetical protein KFL_001040360 [Klebsormidium nitens]|uniref:UBX domain-containing protein n=1 Tax=Klebsormidium nitens TaxID=105231 RepID=A0A1Y1HVP3_KLENI|nr:hypothetical protein KFL_001040360 [Klebsormidium nitens]|eukprot:GAQ82233.1 hypothetical protein KFL_001040360 [Klebsormidium nitens]
MQEVVLAWLPVLLTYALQAAFLLVVLAASVEFVRSAWRQRKLERSNDEVGEAISGSESTGSPAQTSLQASQAHLEIKQELAAEEERKRRAREVRAIAEAETAARRETDLTVRLHQARESQQERQKAEAARKAEEARLKKLEELREREQEVLQAKAARLEAPGNPSRPGQEFEEARSKERELRHRQDAAFQAALAADRARDAELKRIADERERVEKGAAALAERKRKERAAWEERKRKLRESLPIEPPPGTPGRIALSVRLPNNSSFRRAWSPDSPLAEVYVWVDSLEEMSVHPGEYQLVTTFPRQVLEKLEGGDGQRVLLSELAMYPSAALVAEVL